MSGGFGVRHEELDAKADAVGEVSASVREAAAAAQQMGVGGLVYGVLFDPTLLPVLHSASEQLGDLIGTLADATDAIAANLRHNARTYRGVEEFLTQHFGTLTEEAGG